MMTLYTQQSLAEIPSIAPITARAVEPDARYFALIRKDIAGTITVAEGEELGRLFMEKETQHADQ